MALIAFWNGAFSGTASNLAYCAKGAFGTFAVKNSLAFSELTNKPTTLSGYGITDAKISSGTITLGSNSIKPALISDIQNQDNVKQIYFNNNGWISNGDNEGDIAINTNDCYVDLDGWIYAPVIVIGNTTSEAELYFYKDGARFYFDIDKAL